MTLTGPIARILSGLSPDYKVLACLNAEVESHGTLNEKAKKEVL